MEHFTRQVVRQPGHNHSFFLPEWKKDPMRGHRRGSGQAGSAGQAGLAGSVANEEDCPIDPWPRPTR